MLSTVSSWRNAEAVNNIAIKSLIFSLLLARARGKVLREPMRDMKTQLKRKVLDLLQKLGTGTAGYRLHRSVTALLDTIMQNRCEKIWPPIAMLLNTTFVRSRNDNLLGHNA